MFKVYFPRLFKGVNILQFLKIESLSIVQKCGFSHECGNVRGLAVIPCGKGSSGFHITKYRPRPSDSYPLIRYIMWIFYPFTRKLYRFRKLENLYNVNDTIRCDLVFASCILVLQVICSCVMALRIN